MLRFLHFRPFWSSTSEDRLVKVGTIGRFQGVRQCFPGRTRPDDVQESRVGALDSYDRGDIEK